MVYMRSFRSVARRKPSTSIPCNGQAGLSVFYFLPSFDSTSFCLYVCLFAFSAGFEGQSFIRCADTSCAPVSLARRRNIPSPPESMASKSRHQIRDKWVSEQLDERVECSESCGAEANPTLSETRTDLKTEPVEGTESFRGGHDNSKSELPTCS